MIKTRTKAKILLEIDEYLGRPTIYILANLKIKKLLIFKIINVLS